MAYTDHYILADSVIAHINAAVAGIADQFLVSRYVGFVSVSAVTVYELAIKEIFISFAEKKHKVLGEFTRNYFDQINGRIKTRDIKERYLILFGEKYLKRFSKKLDAAENLSLQNSRISILTSYGNIITWRHQFAHEGQIPATATLGEAVRSYESGKEVIKCLAETMQR